MEDEISYGQTTHYELPYPDDYTDMADVPEVVKELAEKIDTEMYNIVGDIDSVLQELDSRKWGGIIDGNRRYNKFNRKPLTSRL